MKGLKPGCMGMIANSVAAAISQQFPARFGGVVAPAANAPAAAPMVMPETGHDMSLFQPVYGLVIAGIMMIGLGIWLRRRQQRL